MNADMAASHSSEMGFAIPSMNGGSIVVTWTVGINRRRNWSRQMLRNPRELVFPRGKVRAFR